MRGRNAAHLNRFQSITKPAPFPSLGLQFSGEAEQYLRLDHEGNR
jgi:hypothetical protein